MKNVSKKILSFVLVLIMLIPCVSYLDLSVSATSGTCGDDIIWVLDDNGIMTISGKGKMTNYSYQTSLPWFSNLSQITEVVIIDGVTSIGNWAFVGCRNLTSVTIPNSVTSVGDLAFHSCESLTSINIGNSVTYIGEHAFYGCKSLTSFTIPSSVTFIGRRAFSDCKSLKSIIIPNSVTSIGELAFSSCDIASITIPDSVTSIGPWAFQYCLSLTTINVSENNQNFSSLNGVLFNKNKTTLIGYPGGKTESNYKIPNTVTTIGTGAFDGCKNLTSITIPDSATYIANSAFSECGLISITIPESVTSIGDCAFYECESLKSITIPYSVTSIGWGMFGYCTSLTSVTILGSVTSIGERMFYNCKSLTSISIPNSVTSVGDYAFYRCPLQTIYGILGSYAETYARENGITFNHVYSKDNTPFDLKTDGYSFANHPDALGYIHGNDKISLDAYIAVFGPAGKQLRESDSTWNGSCFGMAATAALFNEGILNLGDYISNPKNLNASAYTSILPDSINGYYNRLNKDHELHELIEKYQIWSDSKSGRYWEEIWGVYEKTILGSLDELFKYYDNYIIGLWWDDDSGRVGHAALIDSSRTPLYLGDGWYRLYIYDPNYPYFAAYSYNCALANYYYSSAESRYIDVNVNTNHWKADVQINSNGDSTPIGYDEDGYILESEILIGRTSHFPTSFDGNAEWYRSESSANTANVCCANATIYDNDKNIVLQIKNGEVIYKNDGIVIETDMGALDGEVMPSYTIELPFDEFTIDFESNGTAQVFNEEYSYGFVADEGGSATITASNQVEVNGTTDSTVDVVILNETDDETFTSVNVEVKNDGENKTSVALSKENELIVDNVNDNFNATIYWNGQENEYLIQDIAKSDVENQDITEFALTSGELVPNDIIDASVTCETSFVYDGETKTIYPSIKYLGKELTLGVDYVIEGSTSATEIGTYAITVTGCGKYTGTLEITYRIVETPSFEGASLTLADNLKINYKANASLIEEDGYRNPYVVFEMNGVETIANEYKIVDDKLVFEFANIVPHNMNDTIYATLYATHNGVEYASETVEYSVATYCYNTLEKYSADEYAELRTLLVDLLNYGASSQTYMKYKIDDLVSAKLTDEQKAWGTVEERTLETVQDVEYEKIDNPTVSWKSAGLNLEESIGFRFKIATDSVEGLTVKVTTSVGEMTIDSSKFKIANGGYYVFVEGMDASRMSEVIYATVYKDGVAVSNTFRYSIESYAYKMQNNSDAALANLIKAMMKYGDSAKAVIS